jgi:hypothetical protein
MPRKRIAAPDPPKARKIQPKRSRKPPDPPRTTEVLGPFLPDSLDEDDEDDEPGATIECQHG